MAKARKFYSLKAAQDWRVKRGFAATATQHVWKNVSHMAAINAELGGVMPRFTINIQADTATIGADNLPPIRSDSQRCARADDATVAHHTPGQRRAVLAVGRGIGTDCAATAIRY